jgi:hypothetical protein
MANFLVTFDEPLEKKWEYMRTIAECHIDTVELSRKLCDVIIADQRSKVPLRLFYCHQPV